MANINALFPSKWLRAADVKSESLIGIIKEVEVEEVGDDGKAPVVKFDNLDQALVLNKTNAAIIAEIYGEDTDDWIDKPIELFADRTTFKGKMVDALRVRKLEKAKPNGKLKDDDISY